MATDTASKLEELLDAIGEYVGDSKDKAREAALKLLDRESTKSIGEVLFKKGLGQRTAAAAPRVTELEATVKELRDDIAEKNQQITELQSKEPNWQRRIEDNDRKWQQKLEAEQARVLEERRQSLSDKVAIERQKFLAALRLGQEGGVDEDYGRFLPANYADRFVADPESRTVKVLEIGEKTSYYDPSEGEPAEQLARDVIAKLPPKARIVGTPSGGGGTQGGANGVIDKATAQVVEQKARTGAYQL